LIAYEKQRVIDLFVVLDWMLRLPEELKRELWQNIEVFEEKTKMRYVSSVEEIGIEKGILQGMQQGRVEGEARVLARQLTRRFGDLPAWAQSRLSVASESELESWADAVLSADSLTDVFGPMPH
jgi:hypothetical protein